MNNTNNIDTLLKVAVKDIKTAILQSQYRAAKVVNREQLSLYFGIGKYVSENSRKRFWGTGAIESISLQLQKELPGLRGFGARNLKNMRVFYEEWASYLNSAATAAELPVVSNQPPRNQYHLEKYGHEVYPDLLFYNYCCPVKALRGGGWLKAIPNPTKADLLVARGQRPKGAPPRVGRQSDPR
ncbi:MAG: DUF1016 N-terminal domain-containing protein, partial [Bacteroidales bacterium]|nr:DUF1016 N-terminal domain-containing protein [Bacteroidales bacterium]